VAAGQALDPQPRPGVRPKKRRRDRLIRWAAGHPDWVLGFQDETWWSRLARPALHAWAEADRPLRLVEQTVAKTDPDPRALACYGLLARWPAPDGTRHDAVWLRFVDGRPLSALTTRFLAWCAEQAARAGKTALLLVWDNAAWHVSGAVRAWLRAHNRAVRASGRGVRIVACYLPAKSPWLNAIEPKWVHAKRRVVEPDRLLGPQELADRACAALDCLHHPHLSLLEHLVLPEKAA
jgi:hypothetical protein